jgi:hypothetical protein
MKKIKPVPLWKNPSWTYIPSASTDVLKRFKSLGWKAPSESRVEPSALLINN